MVAMLNMLAILLSVYVAWWQGFGWALVLGVLMLTNLVMLLLPAAPRLPVLIIVLLDVCVICMGVVVVAVLLFSSGAVELPLALPWVLGLLVAAMLVSAVNIVRLKAHAGIGTTPP